MEDKKHVMIDVIDLHKYYGKFHAIRGVTTQIYENEVVAMIGPSGGGKSTFLRCLNRLEEPSGGDILIEGIDIMDPHININKIRTEMGMVFQNFGLFPHLTAIENIILAPTLVRKMAKADAEENARKLLKRVGLEDKANNYPDQLSGGQQQRVAIARALAMQPKMLFFDEPTSALDPEMIHEVIDVMNDLARDGMTMVVVSHELGFIRKSCTRVLVLMDGQIIEEGTPEEIFEHPQHERTRDFLSKIL